MNNEAITSYKLVGTSVKYARINFRDSKDNLILQSYKVFNYIDNPHDHDMCTLIQQEASRFSVAVDWTKCIEICSF